MSRLQKKKPSAEKKKKKAAVEKESSSASQTSASKPAAVASPKKTILKESALQSKEPNVVQKAVEFLKEVKVELKKVTWPTRKQTTGTTIVVIIFVFVVAAFLGLFDLGLSKLVQVVLT